MTCSTSLCPLQFALLAYLIGSIPFGWLTGRIFFRRDIRSAGSGNVGATNALRQFGTTAGIAVLLLDLGKGFAAAYLAKWFFPAGSAWIPALGALAIIGHVFPIWLDFKGGKGVATAAGVFIALTPYPVLAALLVFLAVTAISRYVSLGSMCAAVVLLASLVIQQYLRDSFDYAMLAFTSLVVIMIFVKHRQNIQRLLAGKENKIRFSKKGTV